MIPVMAGLSQSRVNTYLKCSRAYYYRYVLNLKKITKAPYMHLGSLVDVGLEAAIEHEEIIQSVFGSLNAASVAIEHCNSEYVNDPKVQELSTEESNAENAETLNKAFSICHRTITALEIGTGRWETVKMTDGKLALQAQVKQPLVFWRDGFVGKIDWLARDTTNGNQLCLIDFKVTKNIKSEEDLQFDWQLPLYQYALQNMLGEEISYTAQYQIRSMIPRKPALLKSGKGVSRSKISSDWQTYRDTVIEYGFNPSDYLEMDAKFAPFQTFTPIYRGSEELANIWRALEEVGKSIDRFDHEARSKKTRGLPVLNSSICGYCDMRELCMGELRGHDTEFIKKTHYEPKETNTHT